MDKPSVLPTNLSDLERDLDSAIARIEDVNIPISTLWDPYNCPIETLPFLAWALSVDQWHSNWSDDVKRQVVAGSLDVHRIKGTRPAVEKALSDLGVTVDLAEWFEAIPQAAPYTFDLIAWVNKNITPDSPTMLGPDLYNQLFAAVVNAKNTRSGFTFKVGAKFGENTLCAGSALGDSAALSRRDANTVQEPLQNQSRITAGIAGVGVGLTRHKSKTIIDASPKAVPVSVASVVKGGAVIYRQMEAI